MDEFKQRTTVTISLADLENLQAETSQVRARVQELERQLVEAKMSDPAGTIRELHAAFNAALRVVQFAVGNLEPSTVRGWPHEAVAAVADGLDRLPDREANSRSLATDLRNFARVAAGYEAYRHERDAKRVVMPAVPDDFGPKTDEAAFAHAARTQALNPAAPGTQPEDA